MDKIKITIKVIKIMEQIYCIYYNNISLMNPRIVGYYTDLNIAETHLRKIGKMYREKSLLHIIHQI